MFTALSQKIVLKAKFSSQLGAFTQSSASLALLSPLRLPAALSVVGAPSSRLYATVTRRRRKEIRKANALETRQIVEFARLFDPVGVTRSQVAQTLQYLGWDFNKTETISSEMTSDFALKEWYCAFEVVPGEKYVLPSSDQASDDIGLGPGVRPVVPEVPSGHDPLKFIHLPSSSPYSSRPPDWLNPVRGLYLDKETATRHAAIRAKGWKLVAIPQPFWEVAARRRHQHYARRDLLLSLVMPLAPFEARPVSLQSASTKRGKQDVSSSSDKGRTSSERAQTASTAELNVAKRQSSEGRSRKARSEARREVNIISEQKIQ